LLAAGSEPGTRGFGRVLASGPDLAGAAACGLSIFGRAAFGKGGGTCDSFFDWLTGDLLLARIVSLLCTARSSPQWANSICVREKFPFGSSITAD